MHKIDRKKAALTLIDFSKVSTRQNLVKTHLWSLSKEKKTAMLLQLWLLMRENAQNALREPAKR